MPKYTTINVRTIMFFLLISHSKEVNLDVKANLTLLQSAISSASD